MDECFVVCFVLQGNYKWDECFRSQDTQDLSGLVARFYHDRVSISYDGGATETSLELPGGIEINDGNWHYVVLVWDTDGSVELRVDTVLGGTDDSGSLETLPE